MARFGALRLGLAWVTRNWIFQFRVFFQFNVIHPDRKGPNYCTGTPIFRVLKEFIQGFASNPSVDLTANKKTNDFSKMTLDGSGSYCYYIVRFV